VVTSVAATRNNMAAAAQPDPTQGGAPDSGASGASQAPANPKQMMLAQLYQMCKRLAQEDPVLSAGLQKAAQGIQEAQTAMVTQPQPQPTGATPPY
jgi:hypothetical protein